jgi:DNA-binding transcriptional MocR family regulator
VRDSRYKSLVDRFAGDIRSGLLPAGTRLPTHRELAAREKIALVTATRVYAELDAAGLVSREQGRGTFVRDLVAPIGRDLDQLTSAGGVIELNFNYPSVPGQAELLRQVLREIAQSGDIEPLLRYQPHVGRPHDRIAIARHLARHGLPVAADRILIVSGAQHGLAVTLIATLSPGDVVAVDALSYPGFKSLAQTLRLDLAPVPVAATGTDLDALEHVCATRAVRAIYTMPTMHNPLGAVMTTAERDRLVGIARRHGQLLIEDASYAYLVADAPPPVAALAPDITVYVSGLSKSIATGLRVGYVAAPEPLLPALESAVRDTTWNTPALAVEIARRWLEDGTYARLEAHKRTDASRRQAIARTELAGRPYVSHPNSYFIWLPLPDDARADRVLANLAHRHISVSTAEPFATTTHTPQAIRLALGSADLDVLAPTLRTVAHVIDLDASQ